MDAVFHGLSEEEYGLLKETIPLVTILIAGADDNIDKEERAWAEKITRIRSYSAEEEYRTYYEEIGEAFAERLDALIEELPDQVGARQQEISRRLAGLNPILHKLAPGTAGDLYKEYRTFSKHVARASGGFLKFFAISAAEKKWVDLPMIEEFVHIPDDEEE